MKDLTKCMSCKSLAERLIILEAALLRISNLDYSRAAVNFAALDAVNIAREALKGLGKEDRVTDSIDPVEIKP